MYRDWAENVGDMGYSTSTQLGGKLGCSTVGIAAEQAPARSAHVLILAHKVRCLHAGWAHGWALPKVALSLPGLNGPDLTTAVP